MKENAMKLIKTGGEIRQSAGRRKKNNYIHNL